MKNKLQTITNMLAKSKPRIEVQLPRGAYFDADRLLAVMTGELIKCPKLLDCTPQSIGGAVMLASRLGLEPDSALGHFYIIPYGKMAQVIIGYRGMLELAMRSPDVKSVYAQEVYAGDTFSVLLGTEKRITHIPSLEGGKRDLVAVYAVAEYMNGSKEMEVMSKHDVDRIRSSSKSGNSAPWSAHYGAMARKTVLRRICKLIPRAIDAQRAAAIEEAIEVGASEASDFMDVSGFSIVEDVESCDKEGQNMSTQLSAKLDSNASSQLD